MAKWPRLFNTSKTVSLKLCMADLPAGRAAKTINERPTVNPNATLKRGMTPVTVLNHGRQENKSAIEQIVATTDGAIVR